MRILITGVTGFVGSYLAEYLVGQSENHEIFGTSTKPAFPSSLISLSDSVTILSGNLLDKTFTQEMLLKAKPDVIYHLAAISINGLGGTQGQDLIINNLQVQLNLFESLLKLKMSPKILVIGSAQEYGLVAEKENPIEENTPLNPVSPYGFSKVAQDLSAYTYFKSYQLPVVRIRAFNHTGPRQSADFVIPSFAKQIVEIERDQKEHTIQVGNLDVIRDFSDVRDIVRAYVLAMAKCEMGEVYNLGSGIGFPVRSLLDKLIQISNQDIEVEIDNKRLRVADNPVTICNYKKFNFATNWNPEITIDQTLLDIYNYWKKELIG